MRIQHNIMAMNSYRNYTANNADLSKNLEKLSSGYKINRAGDDAAGLAISEKMRAQITGLETAQSNAQSGINLVQTAEGALTEVHEMLNRMVELADQSANGTYDNDTDRANLQKEFEALSSEIDRIADASNFNGLKLLDGSMAAGKGTQSAAPANLTGLTGMSLAELSTDVKKVQFVTTAQAGAGVAGSATAALDSDGLLTVSVTGSSDGLQVTAQKIQDAIRTVAGQENATFAGTPGAAGAITANQTGTAVDTTAVAATAATMTNTPATGFSITFEKGHTGLTSFEITSTADTESAANADGVVDLVLDSGKDYSASDINKMLETVGAEGMTVAFEGEKSVADILTGLDMATGVAETITDGTGTLGGGLTLQIGDTAKDYNQINVNISDMHTKSMGLSGLSITTQTSAATAVDIINKAIDTVSATRGDLGATQNRLEHTINNLSVMTENIQDAEASIRDVDVAEEMMEYTKNNILVQSAQAMLAQANQVPQGVLQLLQ